MAKRDVNYLKPPRFKNFFLLSELCVFVGKDPSWIRKLEKDGRIPQAQRVKRGKVEVRLWSPAQASEIKTIIERHRPGRPKNG